MPSPTIPNPAEQLKPLTPSQLITALTTCFGARRAVMVHGDPGTGKSECVMQAADAMFAEKYGYEYVDGTVRTPKTYAVVKGKKVENHQIVLGPSDPRPWLRDVRAALLDNVDVHGLPTIEDGKVKWAIPDMLPSDPRGGVLFLDEINRGAESTQNALFSLCIPPHAIGDYRLPSGWVIASAVNDKDIGARKMSSALNARFTHLDINSEPNDAWLQDVCEVAVRRDWHPMLLAFLRSFPKLMHIFDPKQRRSPNVRGWEAVSALVYQDPPLNLLKALVAGEVGEAAAIEFVSFYHLFKKLPNLDDIITHPQTAEIPTSPSQLYAVSAGLARRATVKNFGQIMTYLERITDEAKRPDYNVACVIDATRRNKELQSEACYTKWIVKYHSLVA